MAAGAGTLKVVGRAGVGIDNICVEAATKNNVVVLKWVYVGKFTNNLDIRIKIYTFIIESNWN